MADVYEAELRSGPDTSKRVAVKILLPDLRKQDQVIKSFIDEATLAAHLSHPNIVQVFDFGQQEDVLYIAMELVDGWNLQQVIRRSRESGLRLPVGAAIYVVHELALALGYIHSLEPPIVHRDVTPHNVFVTSSGHIKLGDFGIAKSTLRQSYTLTGQIKGKLAYLAPEQVTGDPVTKSVDVYAAGLILFELATGERLIKGTNEVELIQAAERPRLIPPSSLNPEAALLDRLVERALQRHSAMRLPSAATLSRRLEDLMLDRPFDAPELASFMQELQSHDGPRLVLEPGGATSSTTAPFHPGGALTETASLSGLVSPSTRPRPIAPAVMLVGIAVAVLTAGVWLGLRLSRIPAIDDSPPAHPKVTSAALDLRPDAPIQTARRTADAKTAATPAVDLEGPRQAAAIAPSLATKRPRKHTARRDAHARTPRRPLTPRPETSKAQQLRQLKLLQQQAQARGLWPGDSPEYARKVAAVRQALGTGKGGHAALQDLQLLIESFKIDRGFASTKLGRLERAIKRASFSEEDWNRRSSRVQKILRLILADRLVEASRLISVEMALLAPK